MDRGVKPEPKPDAVRALLLDLFGARELDLKAVSIAIGKNHAYMHQFVHRGVPRRLGETEREALGALLNAHPDTFIDGVWRAQNKSERPDDGAITIPELDVEAAAGGGAVVSSEIAREPWSFPEYFVRSELGAGRKDLHIITISGDSMISDPPKPRDLQPGDKVVVNVASNSPSPPGIFIVDDGLGLVAKRVELVPRSDPPRIRLMSNNAAYSAYEVELADARIIGRVVARWERIS